MVYTVGFHWLVRRCTDDLSLIKWTSPCPPAIKLAYQQPSADGMATLTKFTSGAGAGEGDVGHDDAVVPSALVDEPLAVEVLEVGGVPASALQQQQQQQQQRDPVFRGATSSTAAGGGSVSSFRSRRSGGGGGGVSDAMKRAAGSCPRVTLAD